VDAKLEHVSNSCRALLIERHKTMASALHRICNEAGLAASTEVQCIPGSTNVPADLYIYSSASDTKPIALDVGIISPQYNSWSAGQGYTMHRMEEVKLRKYGDVCGKYLWLSGYEGALLCVILGIVPVQAIGLSSP
jgi:hypothetical protein